MWNFSFKSAFIDGHWHSDLHKGNLIFMDKKLGIIDFGLIGYLSIFEKSVILNYNSHILKKEWIMASRLFVSKMIKPKISNEKDKINFTNEIHDILKNNFDVDNPNIFRSVSELSECCKKYNTKFNNNYVSFELAFSTLANTFYELGNSNLFDFMNSRFNI